jgi:hypothetical protein
VNLGTSEEMDDPLAGHRNTLLFAHSNVQSISSICMLVCIHDHSKVIDFRGIRTKRSKMKPTIAIPY